MIMICVLFTIVTMVIVCVRCSSHGRPRNIPHLNLFLVLAFLCLPSPVEDAHHDEHKNHQRYHNSQDYVQHIVICVFRGTVFRFVRVILDSAVRKAIAFKAVGDAVVVCYTLKLTARQCCGIEI